MHVAYCGNFEPPHSTENDVARALENNGHTVHRVQENKLDEWGKLIADIDDPHFILWTSTKQYADHVGREVQWEMLAEARRAGTPVVGYHLDRWWGLDRQDRIFHDPFFRVDLLCTADGGHDDQWMEAGVNHLWFPPAISEANCGVGTPREEYASDIAFVGNWQGGYHPEWKHRAELVDWLAKRYGNRVKFWPKRGEHAIRGDDLRDLYASTKVVVGDSCLVPKTDGSPMTHYCSDRIPETLGRGGNLLHPWVDGVTGELFGHHYWELGDWATLKRQVDVLLFEYPEIRESCITKRAEHVRMNHTYEVRMRQLVGVMKERGML
jgi:hypothetical protein